MDPTVVLQREFKAVPLTLSSAAIAGFNDYRAVLGDLFRSMWGLTPEQCAQIFPQTMPTRLNLV